MEFWGLGIAVWMVIGAVACAGTIAFLQWTRRTRTTPVDPVALKTAQTTPTETVEPLPTFANPPETEVDVREPESLTHHHH